MSGADNNTVSSDSYCEHNYEIPYVKHLARRDCSHTVAFITVFSFLALSVVTTVATCLLLHCFRL